ncbi:MAG: PASTA domain-containing protein [Coriobacteriia bacterium]|nr:PASTA domain-containing protein [Coriobacteriia bacterium]
MSSEPTQEQPVSNSDAGFDERAKLPALKRVREPRQALIDPGFIRLVIICAVGVLLVAASLSLYALTGLSTKTPALVGLQENAARENVRKHRLKLAIGQRLYSSEPKGTILSQNPRAGSRIQTGSAVVVSVSGGTEQVVVPDLYGLSKDEAVTRLEDLGLLVSDISEASQMRAGTVISTSPGGGTRLRIGDTVVLHVASATEVITLVDYDLKGQTVVIAPQYCGGLPDNDVTYNVAQRLSALVQAAGGKAVITRASTETTLTAQESAKRASQAHPTASVTITVNGSSSAVLAVSAQQQVGSLGKALFEELKWVSSTTIFLNTTVSSAAPQPRSASVSLGRTDSKANLALFTDDLFCDNVARALYMGLGKTLAK